MNSVVFLVGMSGLFEELSSILRERDNWEAGRTESSIGSTDDVSLVSFIAINGSSCNSCRGSCTSAISADGLTARVHPENWLGTAMTVGQVYKWEGVNNFSQEDWIDFTFDSYPPHICYYVALPKERTYRFGPSDTRMDLESAESNFSTVGEP